MRKRYVASIGVAVAASIGGATMAHADPGQLYLDNAGSPGAMLAVGTTIDWEADGLVAIDYSTGMPWVSCTAATGEAAVQNGPTGLRDTLRFDTLTATGCSTASGTLTLDTNTEAAGGWSSGSDGSPTAPWKVRVTNQAVPGVWGTSVADPTSVAIAASCTGSFTSGGYDVFTTDSTFGGFSVANRPSGQTELSVQAGLFSRWSANSCGLPAMSGLAGTFTVQSVNGDSTKNVLVN